MGCFSAWCSRRPSTSWRASPTPSSGSATKFSNEAGQTWHVDFYRDEMRRRGSARSETTMRRLTWVIAALTVVNVVAVIVALVTA